MLIQNDFHQIQNEFLKIKNEIIIFLIKNGGKKFARIFIQLYLGDFILPFFKFTVDILVI